MLMPQPPELPWWATTLFFAAAAALIAACSRIILSFISDLLAPED